jgi:hypothetical protein
MTPTTAPTAIDLLMELDRMGIRTTLKGQRISLQPASRAPAERLAQVRELKPELTALLAEPRRRWREQAGRLLARAGDTSDREDLQHIFDEREAIASADGGQDDHHAGQLAYETLKNHLREEAT